MEVSSYNYNCDSKFFGIWKKDFQKKLFSVNVKEMECWFIKVNERRSEDTYIGPDD